MLKLINIIRAIGGACVATAGIVGFGTAFPKVALAFGIVGAALVGLGINLPDSAKDLGGIIRAAGLSLTAVAAFTGFATAWPKAAMGIGAAAAFLIFLGTTLKQPAPTPPPPAPGAGG